MNEKLPEEYEVISPFAVGHDSDVFLVKGKKSGEKFLLKTLKKQQEENSSNNINLKLRFKNEIDIVSTLNHPNISKIHNTFSEGENFSLIYPYKEGQTLTTLLKENQNVPQDIALQLMEQLLKALDYIHSKNIVHCDINPNNIFITRDNHLEIFDFGFSLIGNNINNQNHHIMGTIPYLAPEQTSFTDFKIDNRTDLFCSGIIFYQLLSGRTPFTLTNNIKDYIDQLLQTELEPIRNQSISFNQILFKALNPNPEERYQTSDGFNFDISEARKKLEGNNSEILIGTKDKILSATRKKFFVGRELHVSALFEGQNKLSNKRGSSYLIYGISGIGKTEIVREFQRNISNEYTFITIKCNEISARRPLSTIKIGILEIIAHLSNKGSDYVEEIKESISHNLSEFSGILCKNLPELKPFFKVVNEYVTVEREEERLVHVLTLLIKEFTKFEKIIFHIDDIQWIDKTSFGVHKKLTQEDSNLLFIVNFRVKKESVTPFIYGEDLLKLNYNQTLKVSPFSDRELKKYVYACFNPLENSNELIRTLALKTDNTPFSYSEAIRLLVRESIITPKYTGWAFNSTGWLASTAQLDPVTLILRKFELASEEEKKYLQIASLFEGKFKPSDLNELLIIPDEKSELILEKLERLHFIVKGYKDQYNFVHDKLHETISNKFTKEKSLSWHETIGEFYLKKIKTDSEKIFPAAEHYLKSGNQIVAIQTCYDAALNAQQMMGYDLAIRYYKICLLLEKAHVSDDFPENYDSIRVKFNLADMYILSGDNLQAFALLKPLLTENISRKLKMELFHKCGIINYNLADMEKAEMFCKDCLREMGFNLPQNKLLMFLSLGWQFVRMYLPTNFPLSKGHEISDPVTLLKVKVLNKLSITYFFTNLPLCLLSHLKAHNLARKLKLSYEKIENFTMHTVPAYQCFLKSRAFKFSQTSIKISDQFGRKDLLATANSFAGYINFYNAKWSPAKSYFEKATNIFNSIGDSSGQLFSLEQLWLLGVHLGEFKWIREIVENSKKLSGDSLDKQSLLQRNFIELLINTLSDNNDNTNPEILLSEVNETESIMTKLQCKAFVAKVHQLNEDLNSSYNLLQESTDTIIKDNMMQEYITPALSILCETIIKDKLGDRENAKSIKCSEKILNSNLKRVERALYIRSFLFPAYKGVVYRNKAWQQFFKGRYWSAKKYFKKAINAHKILDMKYEEAQSHRDLAIFYEKTYKPGLAREEFTIAYLIFNKCGAVIECKKINEKIEIPISTTNTIPSKKLKSSTSNLNSISSEIGQLRLQSLSKISSSITEIEDINKLLDQILKAMIDVTAANQGLLFLYENEFFDSKSLLMNYKGEKLSLEFSHHSQSIVDLVKKEKQTFKMTNSQDETNKNLPNMENQKSVLCLPILAKENLLGMVYLSHDRIAGLFNNESEKAACVLLGQASVMLESAQYMQKYLDLNKNLEIKVDEQTRTVLEKSKKLETARLKLIESERMRGILTGSLVHDIKNSLAGVEGNLKVLLHKYKNETKGMRNILAASDSCVDLMSLTSNLLDIGKMEEGKLEIRQEPLNFEDVFNLIKKIHNSYEFEEKKLNLIVVNPSTEIIGSWDHGLLSRVLQNLLNNAVKYTPQFGEIKIDCIKEGKEGVLTLFNSGTPLDEKIKKSIFDKYSRVDGKWSQYSKGMGLYFCKMVVEAHGGQILVEPIRNGNKFIIKFPLYKKEPHGMVLSAQKSIV